MVKDLHGQINERISGSSHILIIVPDSQSPDLVGSGLALYKFLQKLEKRASVVALGQTNPKLSFLPGAEVLADKLDVSKSFVIDVSTSRTQIAELSYQKSENRLSIFLKPKNGEFAPNDVSFRSSGFPYDLIVVLGLPSLDQLGEFYSENAELFFQTPVLNIDYKSSNESYGQFNLINLTATSVCEVVSDYIDRFESSLLDQEIATLLLTGIIAETNSFQHSKTTPQAFAKSSQLIALGARQQEIVARLYKSKSLGLLKLWGRCLARLKTIQDSTIAYSAVSLNDIKNSDAGPDDVDAVIVEMISQLSFARILLFMVEETGQSTKCYCYSSLPFDLKNVFSDYSPEIAGHAAVRFVVPKSAADTESVLLDRLNAQLALINR